ncbi:MULTISPECIES: MurR/RpiR family transcriptional regulator [Bacillaceae]|uniref:RpiR family transcriptional regulator n=1 Tax=Bacillus infantis NRRL B-14911 TaxID=1367477 RepID=U5L714_9BACI|nr:MULTISPECIES: MurR/RpiR family transcriptional regulator [Bacillus]OXT17127.1 MurR/RpiR family transcriptional regulator [Bacillus sp. OG2]AGX03163.1 RpiR family transcriptional regulator [Bacillus infantis NRRL B-14911]EAR66652.1 transcriptional regulator (RpiR family) protein [Bacillus sp. NRRL B-14911]MCA1034030.1 MurR/RpiR family transcriptional regulator [Bacillus infantis]MCK6205809.1 MurR/RpiR family transcriptional regulator [Bacillus infantis]
METLYCFARIKTHYSKFSDKEKRIADYILDNPEKIVHSSINQLADDLGIADSTVFRFCKRIGFKGYQALKIALASEIVAPIKDIHETIQEEDDILTVSEKVFRSNINTLEDTLKLIRGGAFEMAVEAILQAEKVEFFGSGGSGIIAQDAYHKFIRTGLTVHANSDSHLQLMSASQLSDKDTAVFISHSGATKDMIGVLKVAKENGARTISITNFAKTPLTQQADIALYTVAEETDYRSEALSSRIAQLSIIDALYVNVMIARKDEGKQALRKMRNAISSKRI